MMKQGIFTVEYNKALTGCVFEMKLTGDASAITAPGQFVNVLVDGLYLRRPISVCFHGDGFLTIIYKVVGEGTKRMSGMTPGTRLDLLTGLGNGYDASCSGNSPLLIGGGVGVPPLYGLAAKLIGEGKKPTVILGFNSKEEIFYEKEFSDLGCKTIVATADGSAGIKGFVTDAFAEAGEYSYFYACGPEPMLRAVYAKTVTSGELSFERRMGCGFGACMGCSCRTITGYKRICKEGPVMKKEELIWGD